MTLQTQRLHVANAATPSAFHDRHGSLDTPTAFHLTVIATTVPETRIGLDRSVDGVLVADVVVPQCLIVHERDSLKVEFDGIWVLIDESTIGNL